MICVVIPSHNRRASLQRCLHEVYKSRTNREYSVCVILDGCTDQSEEMVRSDFPQVHVCLGDGQLWWSGCVNKGLSRARELNATHALLLNDDVQLDRDALESLAQASQANRDSLVGSAVYAASQPGQLWCAGGIVDWFGAGTKMLKTVPDPDGATGLSKVNWLPGMGTLIPMSVADSLGGMDARCFPQYFGDTDFCLRAGKAGFPVLLCPDAKLYNETELTGLLWNRETASLAKLWEILSSIRSHANFQIRLRFWMRHCPWYLVPWQTFRFYAPLGAAFCVSILRRMRQF